ncbi:glycosyltransferase [Paenibacillus cymbidii]|uniref:glycosyltransferase n=1 Tax=Paenibacillus cymbidii TaxID=1639034 RepID=UPI001436900C|nr:glycosyltransferase [Paenibacillus cymbidii]
MLQQDYGAAEARTLHIPLGAPDALPQERALFRKQLNVANRTVAMTFGLLNPYKGIELVLEAIPEVVEKHPDFMYWIVGSTHPDHAYGDSYYNKLVDLIDQYGIHNHVRLISGYQSEQDLIRLLTASDIYINPYWKINAVFASATMTYAARMGKTIISSPIDYSLELLSDGAGMIFPYGDVGAIARQLKMLLADQKEREAMGAKLKRKTSEYGWNDVAAAYWRVIERADDQSWRETDENEFEREREHEREHEQRGNGHELDTDNETDRVTLPIPPVPGDEKKNRPRAQLPASLQTARKRKKRNAAKKKKSPRSRQSRKIHSRYKTARLDTIVTFAAKPAGVKAPKRKRRRRRAA